MTNANNRTFSELNGAVVRNGNFSIRYVMENDSPRFVAIDVARALNYRSPGTSTNAWCKKYGLGKVVGADNKLRTYATKEQVDLILDHARLTTEDFRKFWNDKAVPATDHKYAALKKNVDDAREANRKLSEIYESLKVENDGLIAKVKDLLFQREKITEILGITA